MISTNESTRLLLIERVFLLKSLNIFSDTPETILAEIADGLTAVRYRKSAAEIIRSFLEDPLVKVAPASDELFQAGLELYQSRPDKNWGLTDCFSFVTMLDNN